MSHYELGKTRISVDALIYLKHVIFCLSTISGHYQKQHIYKYLQFDNQKSGKDRLQSS